MKKFKTYLSLAIASALLLLCNSCPWNFDPDTSENSLLDPIEDKYDAKDAVRTIADNVIHRNIEFELSSTAPDDEVLFGLSGTATVNGTASSSNNSCGTDCISSTHTADLTIEFDDFTIMTTSNCECTLEGTVEYYAHEYSQQSGLSYYSSSSYSVSGTNVSISEICDESWGTEDVISFSASGDNVSLVSGWCTTEDGSHYEF